MDRRTFLAGLAAILVIAAREKTAGQEGPAGVAAGHMPAGDEPVFVGADRLAQILARSREEHWEALPIGERTERVARAFVGTPYRASTLEISPDREILSADLTGFDCATLVDTALAMARMLGEGGTGAEALLREIERIRYRDGRRSGYCSRLHYTSDWLFDNDAKGVLALITPQIPGARRGVAGVNYMSTHADAYPALRAHPELLPEIARIERAVSARDTFFVPKAALAGATAALRTGDIVAITTSTGGLDCGHVGIASRDRRGHLGLVHASSRRGQVVRDGSLLAYLDSNRSQTGIMVGRPLEATAPGGGKAPG